MRKITTPSSGLRSYIMCSTSEDLREQSGWPGASAESRGLLMSRLQQFLPPSVMVPGSRLETLLEQSAELQRSRCPFHNTAADTADHGLLVDHLCSRYGGEEEGRGERDGGSLQVRHRGTWDEGKGERFCSRCGG